MWFFALSISAPVARRPRDPIRRLLDSILLFPRQSSRNTRTSRSRVERENHLVREGHGGDLSRARRARQADVHAILGAGDREGEPHHVRSGRDLQHQQQPTAEYVRGFARLVFLHWPTRKAPQTTQYRIHGQEFTLNHRIVRLQFTQGLNIINFL